MNRRGFLGGLAGILAAGIAPAAVINGRFLAATPAGILVPRFGHATYHATVYFKGAHFMDHPNSGLVFPDRAIVPPYLQRSWRPQVKRARA